MQNAEYANRLGHQRSHLRVDRMALVHLVENMIPHRSPDDKTYLCELLQFPLYRTHAGRELPCDLTDIKRLVGPSMQQCQNPATDLPEQNARQGIGVCTHYGDNCIL